MALPINPTPTFTLKVPSTGQKIRYRPFLVKEEKALLIAQQTNNIEVMLSTIRDVIAACVLDPINLDKLASFDIEYIFVQLRAVSVGELVELVFQCDDCTVPEAQVKMTVNLLDLKVDTPSDHTKIIKLFNDVGIVMKYPSLDTIKKLDTVNYTDVDQVFDITIDCIESIFDGDQMFTAAEQAREELAEFLNNLTAEQYEKIQEFFRTMPTLRQPVRYTCPVCKKEHNKYLEGLSSFF